jgi:hypothetical protein
MQSVLLAVSLICGHGLDGEVSSLLAVHALKPDTFGETGAGSDNSEVCEFEASEIVKQGDSYGDVQDTLTTKCQNPVWGYSEALCNEVMSELFKGKDVDALFDESDCHQLQGLISEHWQHELAMGFEERAQDLILMQSDLEKTTAGKGPIAGVATRW